jgi:hypothetical protein
VIIINSVLGILINVMLFFFAIYACVDVVYFIVCVCVCV